MARRHPIVTHPNPILRRKATDVPVARLRDPAFQVFLDDMTESMFAADGIGLAAAQIASPDNVAVVNAAEGPVHLVNPRIVVYGARKQTGIEACLSVPGLQGDVRRSIEIDVEALDRGGRPLSFRATDLLARVIQHEVDHLHGILYIDRAERIWKAEEREKARA